MRKALVTVSNRGGLHMRPSMQLAKLAQKFDSQILIEKGDQAVDAKSMLDLMTLAMSRGESVWVSAEGVDEDDAIKAVVASFGDSFGEEDIYG